MTRSLYSKRPNPYYIMAPKWYRASAGIRVMHMLCDALVRSGQEAYIHTTVVNPALMTPLLTHDVYKSHKDLNLEPIVVYPEVITGNPMAANVVVRYLLNRPGFIDGDGQYADDDILFAFAKDLLPHGTPDDQVLFLPPFDMSVFCPPQDPAKRVPGKACYYQGRDGRTEIDPALLREDSVEITRTYPDSWEALADLFQQCEFFYCTESSALAGEAALCGCISVVLPNRWAPRPIGANETQGLGVAWGNSPEQIEWARSTVPQFRERMVHQEQEFWAALDHFIDFTQKAAQTYQSRPKGYEIRQWLGARTFTPMQRQLIQQHADAQPLPSVAVVVMDSAGDLDQLSLTLDSIRQLAGPLTLRTVVVAPDISRVEPQAGLHAFQVDGGQQLAFVNDLLLNSDVDWMLILQAGDELMPSGVLKCLLEMAGASGCMAVYADEIIRQDGGALGVMFRPDFNLDLTLSCPTSMVGHWFYRRSNWQAMGGFATDLKDAYELHFILRLIEEQGIACIGHASEPLLSAQVKELRHCPETQAVILGHLQARGYADARVVSQYPGRYELDYGHQGGVRIGVMLVVDDDLEAAQGCVDSLLSNTSYDDYEIMLLDRGNTDPHIVEWLAGVEQLAAANLRVLRFDGGLSCDEIRNRAAQATPHPVLLFVTDKLLVTGGAWLENMLNHALRPEVGCVAPKLIGTDRKIDSGGLLLGYNGPVGNMFHGMSLDASGYLMRLELDQNYAALSGQCLMVRRDVFLAAGGFDEQMAPWTDVDLCLKVHQAGFMNVWTPRAQLVTTLNEPREPTTEQITLFYQRWLSLLANDPSYNLNFSLRDGMAFELADSALSWRPLSGIQPVPLVLVHPASRTGHGDHRVVQPFTHLRDEGLMDGLVSKHLLSVIDLQRYDPDVIVFQEQTTPAQLNTMLRIKTFSRAFKVYDLHQYLPGAPAKSQEHAQASEDVLIELRHAASFVDRLLVASDAMAEVFAGFNPDIRVLKDRLDPAIWGSLRSERNVASRPRVGWVGSYDELADLALIEEVVRDLALEVEWVFYGACPDHLRPFVHEYQTEVDAHAFPATLASLNLDLALLPRKNTLYNRCRGHQSLLAFGICGVPVICSDLEPHRGDLAVKRVQDDHQSWIDAIRAHVQEVEGRGQLGDYLRSQVLTNWMLEGAGLEEWRKAWLPG